MSDPAPAAPDAAIRAGSAALLVAQSIALALALAWPAPARLWTEAIGTSGGDVAKHVWNLWWSRAEVRDGAAGLATTLVNWPEGMRLYPIEPLNSALAVAIPLQPVALSNVLALLHLVLVGLCAGWLGGLVSGTRRGALATAALAQGSAFVAFTLHVGVGELRQVWWIPLGLGCLVRARATRAPAWFAALGATLGVATLACFYHGLFLATAVALHALATLRAERRLLLGYVGAAALAAAIVAPVVGAFAGSYGPADATRPDFVAWMRPPFAVDTYAGASLELPDLVRPRADERDGAERAVYAYTGGRYLGVVALALALAGAFAAPKRARPWLVVGAAAIVLAMGTVVWWNGAVALQVTLPMAWINRALGWAAEPLNFPVRFVSVAAIAVAVLGGLAVTRWRYSAALVPLALVDIARHDLVPWPRDTTMFAFGTKVAVPPGAVADLTVMLGGDGASPTFTTNEGALVAAWLTTELRTRAIAAQLRLDRPFQTVPIERQEMWHLEGLLWTAALPLSDALVTGADDPDGLAASLWLLRDAGFGSVVLTHPCGEPPDATAAALLDGALGPRVSSGCFDAWPIPEVPADDPRAAGWREAHAARVARLPPPTLLSAADKAP